MEDRGDTVIDTWRRQRTFEGIGRHDNGPHQTLRAASGREDDDDGSLRRQGLFGFEDPKINVTRRRENEKRAAAVADKTSAEAAGAVYNKGVD